MRSYQPMDTKIIENKKTWENFLNKHFEANFLQSWFWGEFHESLGRKIFRVGFFINKNLEGVCFCYIETSKRAKYLVVPGGPILDWNNNKLIREFVSTIKKVATENQCIFARVRPQLVNDTFARKIFSDIGFKNAPMYLHAELTSQLDILKPEDELLANMRKTTRYEIKKAISLGIKISDKYDSKTSSLFIKLQDETAKRQKFVPFSKNFLTQQFEIFIKKDLAKLYTAKHDNKVLAQAFVIFYGAEAVYHYGASTNKEGRKFPGAYLIQWEAIKEARKRGMSRYNFWGVAPENSKDHRFSGLSLFKRGFGGVDVAYLPAQDLVIDRKRYLLDYWFEKIRRKLRHS